MLTYCFIYFFFLLSGMAYNFQKYNLDRIQYLGAPYDTSYYIYIFSVSLYSNSISLPAVLSLFLFYFFSCPSIFCWSYCRDRLQKGKVYPTFFVVFSSNDFQSIDYIDVCLYLRQQIGSVMHYDAFAFAKNRERPTIIAKKQGTELGQRRGFSDVSFRFQSYLLFQR